MTTKVEDICEHLAGIDENNGPTELPRKNGHKFSLSCC
jgi:hypothetical protein